MRQPQPLHSGDLDQRVTIAQKVYSSPPDEVASYSTVATVWAEVDFRPGNESVEGNREINKQIMTVKIRFREDVNSTMRLTYRSVEYDIRDIAPGGKLNREFLTLECRAVR